MKIFRKVKVVEFEVPDHDGEPLFCCLCGKRIEGAWQYRNLGTEKWWMMGDGRYRHDRCEL